MAAPVLLGCSGTSRWSSRSSATRSALTVGATATENGAVVAANVGHAPSYGDDPVTAEADGQSPVRADGLADCRYRRRR